MYPRQKKEIIFQDQGIKQIVDISSCRNITVLYLYNNKLTEIQVKERREEGKIDR